MIWHSEGFILLQAKPMVCRSTVEVPQLGVICYSESYSAHLQSDILPRGCSELVKHTTYYSASICWLQSNEVQMGYP